MGNPHAGKPGHEGRAYDDRGNVRPADARWLSEDEKPTKARRESTGRRRSTARKSK